MNCIDLMSETSNNAKLQKWSNYEEVHGFDVKTNKNVELRPKPFKTTQIYKIYQSTMNCIDLMSKTSNNAKLQKWSNYDELHRFDVKTIKKCCVTSQTIPNTAKLQRLSKYNELHRFDVKTIKYVELRPKPFKTTQTYKSNQIAMNWIDLMSKTSNNAKLQKWSNYDEVHGLDVKTNKNVELRRKPFKTTQIYKGYQSTMNCIDLMSKRTKMMSYVGNHSKQRKSTKVFKLRWIASIWCQKHQTTQNYKSDQITRKCMDLTSKRTKMLSYVPNHSKQRKSTKFIKVQWIASIWCQNDQKCWVTSQTIPNTAKLQKWSNYDELHRFDVKTIKNVELRSKPFDTAKLQKWSNYDELHRFDVKTIKYVELRPKPFQTQQNYKSDQITMNWIDLTSKRSKMLSYVRNHSKHSKTTKVIKLRWIGSIWRQNDKKCWVTSQTIQNNSNLQK